MKSLILYASPHHGNTKKVAERMAKKIGARLVDVIREEPPDLAGYRLIGLASGAYFGTLHKSIVKIAQEAPFTPEQRVFPDPENLERIPALIQELGGVDVAFGGIGINGHLAFNEPQPELTPVEFAALSVRTLDISRETITANAIGDLGGAIGAMPRRCVTIGMAQILGAKKVRLGVFRDWHRAVVRRAAYGPVTAEFPVTLLQNHPDAKILSNANAAKAAY